MGKEANMIKDFNTINLIIHQKSFKEKVLYTDSSVLLKKGEMIMITGDSGSGKTTLLKLLMGRDCSFQGKWLLNSNEIDSKKRWPIIKTFSSFVFQDVLLIDYLTAKDNILLPFGFSDKKVDKTFFDEIVSLLDIASLLDTKAILLSGGEKERIAIARALIIKPSIIFADEPTASLDDRNVNLFMFLMEKINKKYNTTIVMVTHRESLAAHFNVVYRIKDHFIYEEK